jgi:CO/xanthine dehydrogenase FAD-binding subunit
VQPAAFRYVRPVSVAEALDALEAYYEDAKILAGGQSLVPTMSMRLAQPAVVVDINAIREISSVSTDGTKRWSIGALVRHHELESMQQTDGTARLLRRAARDIGHLPIRIRGAMGGSLAHADPGPSGPSPPRSAAASCSRVAAVSAASTRRSSLRVPSRQSWVRPRY